jgi:hypothetical protein
MIEEPFSALESGDGFEQRFLAAATDAGDAEDLSASASKETSSRRLDAIAIKGGEMFDFENGLRMNRGGPGDVELNVLAHHRVGQDPLRSCLWFQRF